MAQQKAPRQYSPPGVVVQFLWPPPVASVPLKNSLIPLASPRRTLIAGRTLPMRVALRTRHAFTRAQIQAALRLSLIRSEDVGCPTEIPGQGRPAGGNRPRHDDEQVHQQDPRPHLRRHRLFPGADFGQVNLMDSQKSHSHHRDTEVTEKKFLN